VQPKEGALHARQMPQLEVPELELELELGLVPELVPKLGHGQE